MRGVHGLSRFGAVISALAAIDYCALSKPRTIMHHISREKADILIFDHACPLFEAHVGRIPVRLEELVAPPANAIERAKWSGPYVEKLGVDPWGHRYRCQGDGKSKPRIWSLGPDGINGTADDIANE